MKNKTRPFFYEEKKHASPWAILVIAVLFIGVMIWAFKVPRLRQKLAEPLWAFASLGINSAKDFVDMTRRGSGFPEREIQATPCPTLELPDRQVLFADNLTGLSIEQQTDPLAELRQTPTVSPYDKVAQWEYLDPELNYQISGANTVQEDENRHLELLPPVEERADIFNDGAAALSAMLRFWGNSGENQYHIAEMIHPEALDPSIHPEDLESYLTKAYPDYHFLSRINGKQETIIRLLEQGVPMLLRLQRQLSLTFWPGDDRFSQRYVFLYGYDSTDDCFLLQDPVQGKSITLSTEELLSLWYPFQRSYILVYPEEVDEKVQNALLEEYYEELSLQRAETKFKTDCEMLPENPYAHYNYGVVLYRQGHVNEAWSSFEEAMALGLPQRYFLFQSEIFDTALQLGRADIIDELTKPLLNRGFQDNMLLTYRGWAEYLRGNIKAAKELFSRAERIAPANPTLQYALRYIEQ